MLLHINNFSNKIVDVIRKSHEFRLKIVRVITIVVSNPVNFLVNALLRQSIAYGYSMTSRFAAILLLSPPSYILYTLVRALLVEVNPFLFLALINFVKSVWIPLNRSIDIDESCIFNLSKWNQYIFHLGIIFNYFFLSIFNRANRQGKVPPCCACTTVDLSVNRAVGISNRRRVR